MEKITTPPLLATLGEAARSLGLGLTKVKELVAKGELRSVKLGRARRVRWTDLEAYVERLGGQQQP
ncbi:MAG: helix-turn-helix domain-containing protein [SAR202 cluster bacterium]|nr:helix-turn-helix domain-containing protein [SAR202 cluster bacterium]